MTGFYQKKLSLPYSLSLQAGCRSTLCRLQGTWKLWKSFQVRPHFHSVLHCKQHLDISPKMSKAAYSVSYSKELNWPVRWDFSHMSGINFSCLSRKQPRTACRKEMPLQKTKDVISMYSLGYICVQITFSPPIVKPVVVHGQQATSETPMAKSVPASD